MVSAADHQGTAGHSASEVLEEEATGDIKGVYGDIRNALRSSYVPDVFLSLATELDYLQLAWRQLHTNAQTLFFEQSADAIRELAVQHAVALRTDLPSPPEGMSALLKTFNYVTPKVLLAITAMRVATTGQRPRLADIPAGLKRQIVPGVPETMASPNSGTQEALDPDVDHIYAEMRSILGLRATPRELRVLAASPHFLNRVWTSMSALWTHPDLRTAERELKLVAEEAVLAFPFRMDLSPHTLRHCGMTESGIDHVRDILDRYALAAPRIVLAIAALTAGTGNADTAARSPYPADVQ